MEIVSDWFFKHIREMIKNDTTVTLLNKIRIEREKDGFGTFNFSVRIDKSLFEDLLSDNEKALLGLRGDKNE